MGPSDSIRQLPPLNRRSHCDPCRAGGLSEARRVQYWTRRRVVGRRGLYGARRRHRVGRRNELRPGALLLGRRTGCWPGRSPTRTSATDRDGRGPAEVASARDRLVRRSTSPARTSERATASTPGCCGWSCGTGRRETPRWPAAVIGWTGGGARSSPRSSVTGSGPVSSKRWTPTTSPCGSRRSWTGWRSRSSWTTRTSRGRGCSRSVCASPAMSSGSTRRRRSDPARSDKRRRPPPPHRAQQRERLRAERPQS